MDKHQMQSRFPLLREIELLEELSEHGIERTFENGEVIMRKGQYMKYIPLILSGSVKVLREDDQGNEILLYYLEGGNSCAMSITCCMKEEKSKIQAIAEETAHLVLIPTQQSNAWMRKYSSWRDFILMSYSTRLDELLFALDSVAFHSLDERLLTYLQMRSKKLNTNEFEITHQEIAKELNSSREAISRLLKKLETLGQVKLGRNRVHLIP